MSLCGIEWPKFLVEFKKDLEKNENAMPSAVIEQNEKFLKDLRKINNEFYEKICFKGNEKDLEKKEKEISNRTKELKNLDKELSQYTDKLVGLEVKVNVMKDQINEQIKINPNDNEITTLENLLCCLEKEKVDKLEDLKKTISTYKVIYNFYRKYTGCKLKLISNEVIRIEFTPSHYVTLQQEDMKTNWSLIDINPDVLERNELERKLTETCNVQALLACVYEAFKPIIKQATQNNKELYMEIN